MVSAGEVALLTGICLRNTRVYLINYFLFRTTHLYIDEFDFFIISNILHIILYLRRSWVPCFIILSLYHVFFIYFNNTKGCDFLQILPKMLIRELKLLNLFFGTLFQITALYLYFYFSHFTSGTLNFIIRSLTTFILNI